ncbi:MAG TPA: RidA family protein [Firmicutes bacterium]|nr:RidA family protein [Candidatus Fermentithermobacillaceae bacterium]
MAVRKLIQPDSLPVPTACYSQGLEVSGKRLIFIAGQLPVNSQGAIVGEGDFKAQVIQVFENIKAVLEDAGASFDDLVKLNIYLTDVKNLPIVQEVRSKYLTRPYPATTLVEITALANPKAMVEIEGIAVI